MTIQPSKLFTILGLSALITFILTRFLNVSCSVDKNTRGTHPQTITDSNKNIFEGVFQPAFININIGSNNK